MITARRLDQLEETKTQCGDTSKILVLAGDISDELFILELFKQTVSAFGKAPTYKVFLDTRFDVKACRTARPVIQRADRCKSLAVCLFLMVCLQNAGMSYRSTLIEDLSIEAFRTVMDVNVTSALICTREAFKIFKVQEPPGGQFFDACGCQFSISKTFRKNHQQRIAVCAYTTSTLFPIHHLETRYYGFDKNHGTGRKGSWDNMHPN